MNESQLSALDALVRGLQTYHNNGEVRACAIVFVDFNGNLAVNFGGDPHAHYQLLGGVCSLQHQMNEATKDWFVSERPQSKMEPVPEGAENVVPLPFGKRTNLCDKGKTE